MFTLQERGLVLRPGRPASRLWKPEYGSPASRCLGCTATFADDAGCHHHSRVPLPYPVLRLEQFYAEIAYTEFGVVLPNVVLGNRQSRKVGTRYRVPVRARHEGRGERGAGLQCPGEARGCGPNPPGGPRGGA